MNIKERMADLSIPEPNSGCFLWLGNIHEATGYGRIWDNGHRDFAHRIAYEIAKGPIPKDLEIDHLCRLRCCVNPDHLEAVTHRENIIRGASPASHKAKYAARTHCKYGHLLSEENTAYVKSRKWLQRRCRECDRLRAARLRAAAR